MASSQGDLGTDALNLLVVVAHPGESLTKAIATEVVASGRRAGAHVKVHDLYADDFDPRMPLTEVGSTTFGDALTARYAADVLAADAVVVVHPVWFFHAPAIIKGWVDRVMREGVVYDIAGSVATSRLRARALHVFNSANAPAEVEAALGGQLEKFWLEVVFGSTALSYSRRTLYAKVAASSATDRQGWLTDVRRKTEEMLAELGSGPLG